MADNYYQQTGVISLEKITPIINALFANYGIQASISGNATIAYENFDSDVRCSSVATNISAILKLEPENPEDLGEVLMCAAEKIGKADDLLKVYQSFGNEGGAFGEDDEVDIAFLFEIAKVLDDGHGIKSIQTEGARTCSKMRIGEFGGNGEFCGRHFYVATSSGEAAYIGEAVNDFLAIGDTKSAAEAIARHTRQILNGISNEGLRKEVAEELKKML